MNDKLSVSQYNVIHGISQVHCSWSLLWKLETHFYHLKDWGLTFENCTKSPSKVQLYTSRLSIEAAEQGNITSS